MEGGVEPGPKTVVAHRDHSIIQPLDIRIVCDIGKLQVEMFKKI
jgi:hypothetical protein